MTPAPTRPISVAIVDDHPVVREGIASWIARDPDRRVALTWTGDSVAPLLGDDPPDVDVVLLDLNLHDVLVVDRVPELCAAGHRVVAFSQDSDPATILAVLDAGASAYLAKHEGMEHCVETIVTVATDRPYVTPSLAGALATDERPSAPRLSHQERQALRLWFQGMSKASVARRMNITEHTVKQYIDRARVKYVKAGRPAPTTFALLARAIEDGLIDAREIGDYRPEQADQGAGDGISPPGR